MSKTELQQVTKGCLDGLHECMSTAPPSLGTMALAARDRWFMALLVTATLCLGLAPRSQVLKQLRIGTSFTKQVEGADGASAYWVKLVAQQSKNGRPTMFALPSVLTPIFDYYLATVRPRLLASSNGSVHDYVFMKSNGSAPRADFTSCTSLITQHYVGRPINPHAFRAAVITTYYDTGASQSDMNVLADIMAHDPKTAHAFYYRPEFSQVARAANDKMMRLLLHTQ